MPAAIDDHHPIPRRHQRRYLITPVPTVAQPTVQQHGHGARAIRREPDPSAGVIDDARLTVRRQQLRAVGIVLDIRSYEAATFLSDVTRGEFQVYSLRWIGGNQDPDIFDLVFNSARFPPQGANRGFYSNPRVDTLINQARQELHQNKRKQMYAEVQQILADDLPYINLWYFDNVLVHSKRVSGIKLNPSGNYDFLKTAELTKP